MNSKNVCNVRRQKDKILMSKMPVMSEDKILKLLKPHAFSNTNCKLMEVPFQNISVKLLSYVSFSPL